MKQEFSIALRALLFIAIAVGAWLMGIVIGQENAVTILNPYTSTANIRSGAIPAVSIMMDYNNGNIDIFDEIELISHANLWEAMVGADSMDKFNLGYNDDYLDNSLQWYGINGVYNSDGSRWYIWLNNKLQSELPDTINVKNGDVLLFKYLSYYPR